MAVTINTNVDSLKIQNILGNSTNKLSQAMERMSSGLKINRAGDDAAGTVIAAKMDVQLGGNKIAQNNIQNATNMLSTVEGNLDVVQDNLARIRDLTLQAKNSTYSKDEKEAMQAEITERIAEIDRVSTSSKYSGLHLFNGDATTDPLNAGATFQVGADARGDNTITISSDIFKSVKFSALTGMETVAQVNTDGSGKVDASAAGTATIEGGFDVSTLDAKNLSLAVQNMDNAINSITARKSAIGSTENRLSSALATLTTQYENLSSSKSVITDADIASEASTYTQNQILQQISVSLLAQANQAPAIATSLI